MDVLSAQNLSVAPRGGPVVLSGLSFQVRKGEFTALLGPNGSGKSTLLRTLAGLLPAKSGELRAPACAFVPSAVAAIPGLSSREVCALARLSKLGFLEWRSPEDHRIVERSLEAFGMSWAAGRPFDQLSDGERKKVLLARALAQECDVIILDEPCAFLDAPQRLGLYALLDRLAREEGKAVLISSHHWEAVLEAAPFALLLDSGRLHWGAPEDFIVQGLLERMPRPQGVVFDADQGRFKYGQGMPPAGARDWKEHYALKLGMPPGPFQGAADLGATARELRSSGA